MPFLPRQTGLSTYAIFCAQSVQGFSLTYIFRGFQFMVVMVTPVAFANIGHHTYTSIASLPTSPYKHRPLTHSSLRHNQRHDVPLRLLLLS
jgi:hypothetical protein